MKDLEVNQVIAKFMGLPISDDGEDVFINNRRWEDLRGYFTESLDHLVPVWGKMDTEFWVHIKRHDFPNYHITLLKNTSGDVLGIDSGRDSIFASAAFATAEAIVKLKDRSQQTGEGK